MRTLYLLDDDTSVLSRVEDCLGAIGCETTHFARPHAFFYAVHKCPPKVAVIGRRLAEMDGLSVVRRLRELLGHDVGLLVLTPLDDEEMVVQALQAGADDCVVKHGSEPVFRARLLALLRRSERHASSAAVERIERFPYQLDRPNRTVTLHGKRRVLAPREFALAWHLFCDAGRLLTKSELLAAVWGKDCEVGSATITQHVYLLRRKLELADHGFRLSSVFGTGYRLDPPAQRQLDERTC